MFNKHMTQLSDSIQIMYRTSKALVKFNW